MPQLRVILHKNAVASKQVVVDCYTVADEAELVVHRQLDAKGEPAGVGWHVTHRRTTFTLGSPYRTRDLALEALKRISAAGLNWRFDEVGSVDMREHKRVTEETFAALVGFDSGDGSNPRRHRRRRRRVVAVDDADLSEFL